jgi:hypothetical protein
MNASKAYAAALSPRLVKSDRHRSSAVDTMPTAFANHYRCPAGLVEFSAASELSPGAGYFRFGKAVCYGRLAGASLSARPTDDLHDALDDVQYDAKRVALPFDLSEVVTNLQHERYALAQPAYLQKVALSGVSRTLYDLVRPILPVGVRKYLQRIGLSDWDRIAFPEWPVDVSVETLMGSAMKLALKHSGLHRLPFIWFWPDGAPSCAIMTHDVETRAGRDFCDQLMDLDDASGIKAAFQIVPEGRYDVPATFLDAFRRRGFEINIHDLDHDGRLFQRRSRFMHRVARINEYAAQFGSRGFRAGVMYRKQEWFEALDFSYDMSVPNVAHLEPQRGGCCTVMPYFVGKILELPLTTVQDYSLFHILGDYSIALWKSQVDMIRAKNGLISFIVHPDYLLEARARAVYRDLLSHLRRLRDDGQVWMALPGDVDTWWRERAHMTVVPNGRSWRIDGPGSDRARLAYATLDGDRLVYTVDPVSPPSSPAR